MAYDPYKALYIHLPFCKHRCSYCDFTTRAVPKDSPEIDEYVEGLIREIRQASRDGKLSQIETVYLGGGTPSYIGSKHLSSLLYMLGVSMNLSPAVECSMEANPDSITFELIKDIYALGVNRLSIGVQSFDDGMLRFLDRAHDAQQAKRAVDIAHFELIKDIYALGVNRLSIGVQSFDDGMLRFLDRAHDAQQAKRAVDIAHERFENVSIDLMCGIPGQTPEMFQESLSTAIDLGVSHISIYPLTIEEHTPLCNKVDAGEVPDVVQDHQAYQMAMAEHILEPAGLMRYEVASYASQGNRCRHNIAYWTGVPYLGLGTSAVTMTQNSSRRMRVQDGHVVDDLNRRQMTAEDLMMKMRMTRGVSEDELAKAAVLLPDALDVFRSLVRDNLVKREDGRYKPTFGGWLLGNELYGRIYELAP